MMQIIRFIFIYALLYGAAIAEERIIGHDQLAFLHPRFNAQHALPNSAVGILDLTFGDSLAPLSSSLSRAQYNLVRVHLLNAVCVRNGNCGNYEPLKGFSVSSLTKTLENPSTPKAQAILKHVRTRTLLYRELAQTSPHVKFLVSPALEHNLSHKAWRPLAQEVKNVWPEVQLVNSAMNGDGEKFLGAWREHHGKNPKDVEITSLDGMEGTDINVSAWLQRTRKNKITFVWSRLYNCRHQGAFQDPRKRKSCPNKDQFELLAHLTDKRPPAPNPKLPCTVWKFKSPDIWKPFAEDKGNPDPRANYPVAILKGQNKAYAVIGKNGKRVGRLGYYDRFEGNQNRYYAGWKAGARNSGYALEQKAFDTQGSPWVWLKQNKACYGPFIPGIRQGNYR